jgi:hypothetical protein
MKVIILTALATSVIISGALATQTTGTIASINKKSDTITLKGGKRYHLPEGIEVESLGVGENVKVSYKVGAGQRREVSAIHAVH